MTVNWEAWSLKEYRAYAESLEKDVVVLNARVDSYHQSLIEFRDENTALHSKLEDIRKIAQYTVDTV